MVWPIAAYFRASERPIWSPTMSLKARAFPPGLVWVIPVACKAARFWAMKTLDDCGCWMGMSGFQLRDDGELVVAGGNSSRYQEADRVGCDNATFRGGVVECRVVPVHQEPAAAEGVRTWVGCQAHRFRTTGRMRERSPDGVDALWNWAYHLDLLVGWVVHPGGVTAVTDAELDTVMGQRSEERRVGKEC